MHLPTPIELKTLFPLSSKTENFISASRKKIEKIVLKNTRQVALLVGPCSIHDPLMALEYAERLKTLATTLQSIFLIMRVFVEKPRTRTGWKGILYDPNLDGSNHLVLGLKTTRSIFLEIAKLEVPSCTELLEPLATPYFEDLVSWGVIGARTSASQPHRQLASGLPFPVGFKNDIQGELDVAISGILSARMGHSFLSINDQGQIRAVTTKGNPLTHLILRGSNTKPNFDPRSVSDGIRALETNGLQKSIVIDCAHGNSGKDHLKQRIAFQSVVEQIVSGNESIRGLMLESHLFPGKQPLSPPLRYGISITDSCIGWEETEDLIRWADEQLSLRPIVV